MNKATYKQHTAHAHITEAFARCFVENSHLAYAKHYVGKKARNSNLLNLDFE